MMSKAKDKGYTRRVEIRKTELKTGDKPMIIVTAVGYWGTSIVFEVPLHRQSFYPIGRWLYVDIGFSDR